MRTNAIALAAALSVGGLAILAGGIFNQAPARQTGAEPSAAGAFTVDSVHSMVVFKIGHLGVSNNYGRFNAPAGTFLIDPANPGASTIDVSLKTEAVDTGNGKRDDHLRSADFFNAKQFPSIAFKSTAFRKTGDTSMIATGDLTLNGVTRSIEADIQFLGEGKTPQGYKQGFEASFAINRSDFGMTKYLENDMVGDQVSLMIALEGARR